ncbi:MAG: hypothetical protein BalsKO_18920 [Balneolaceae bacterium]
MENALKLNSKISTNSIQFEIEMLQDFYEITDTEEEVFKSKLHFLIVDDDYDLVSYIQDCLHIDFENITVVAVSSGEKALNQIGQKIPDVLITDLSMPEMDGFQLISEVNRNHGISNLKILVITGKELSKKEIQLLEKEYISGLMYKPFDSEELKKNVQQILNEI